MCDRTASTHYPINDVVLCEFGEFPIGRGGEAVRYFFNNCRGRHHKTLFGGSAFYDLNLHGAQSTQANDLRRGDECVVAEYCENGDVKFTWIKFTHEKIMPVKGGSRTEKFRVQFGEKNRTVKLPKTKAAATNPYSVFFNTGGHFKQQSVINSDV